MGPASDHKERQLFKAYTLNPCAGELQFPVLPRERLLQTFRHSRDSGTLGLVVGPIDSGKTILALQWVQALGRPVQYIGTKRNEEIPTAWFSESNDLGQALADLFNAGSILNPDPCEHTLRVRLERLIALSKEQTSPFVVDDIQRLSRRGFAMLEPMLREALPEMPIETGLVTSRALDPFMLSLLHASGSLRAVMPMDMEFTVEEARTAWEMGIFGTADLNQVLAAREESNGWIGGMLVALTGRGGRTTSVGDFQHHLLNDLLLRQNQNVLNLWLASAWLPAIPYDLWEHLASYCDIPAWNIPSALAQLPARILGDDSRTSILALPFKSALRNLTIMAANSDRIRDILTQALEWYVVAGDIAVAKMLALEVDLQDDFLRYIKPRCRALAEEEDWTEVIRLLHGVPGSVLLEDPELTFWTLHGRMEAGGWADMNRLFTRVKAAWANSDDPLVKGQLLLVKAWNSHMLNRASEARQFAEDAFHILPEEARRERLWAAGTASIASSYLELSPVVRKWNAEVNMLAAWLPVRLRWWHNIANPVRASWMAVDGQLNDAYDHCQSSVIELNAIDPECTSRYLLLMAQIDIERLRFDSAERLIEKAKRASSSGYSHTHFLRITTGLLHHVRSRMSEAPQASATDTIGVNGRLDLRNREATFQAMIALETGDVHTAEIILASNAVLGDNWPKYFGDPHPDLLHALIHLQSGRYDEAFKLASTTVEESSRRNHTYFTVASYATLAFIQYQHGNLAACRDATAKAVLLSGNSGFQRAFFVLGTDVRTLATAQQDVAVAEGHVKHSRHGHRVPAQNLLTAREIEVLKLASEKLPNKHISERMFISLSTVKNHLANVNQKLGTRNRREAIRVARELGIFNS